MAMKNATQYASAATAPTQNCHCCRQTVNQPSYGSKRRRHSHMPEETVTLRVRVAASSYAVLVMIVLLGLIGVDGFRLPLVMNALGSKGGKAGSHTTRAASARSAGSRGGRATKAGPLASTAVEEGPTTSTRKRRTARASDASQEADAPMPMVQLSFSDDLPSLSSLEEPRGVRKTRGRGRPPKAVAPMTLGEGEADEDLVNGYLSADEQLVLAREIKTLAQWRAVKGLEEQRVGRELSMSEWARLLRVSEGNLERQLRQSFLARSTLVTTNMMLVYSVAHKALKGPTQDKADGGSPSLEDLVNEGTLGVLRAAEKFDPERGIRFSTYACWWIRHCISVATANHSAVVRLPLKLQTRMRRAKAARTRLYLQLGREPTNSELATALDERVEKVVALRRAAKGSRGLHANQYTGTESRDDAADRAVHHAQLAKIAHRDVATNPVVSAEEQRLRAEVESLLGQFKQPEQEILRLKWGLYDALPPSFAPLPDKKAKADASTSSKTPKRASTSSGRKLTIKQIAACCQSSYDKIQRLEQRATKLLMEQSTLMATMGYGARTPLDLVHQLFTEAQAPTPPQAPMPSFA